MSWAEFADTVRRLAAALRAVGMRRGQVLPPKNPHSTKLRAAHSGVWSGARALPRVEVPRV